MGCVWLCKQRVRRGQEEEEDEDEDISSFLTSFDTIL